MQERHGATADCTASHVRYTPVVVKPRQRSGERNEANAADVLEALGLTVVQRQYEVQLDGGHIYTADLLVTGRDGKEYLVEVKGPYRHGSVGRSRLAFDTARAKTGLGGIWIERRKASKGKDAHWRVEVM
jgi:predicted RecB family endonuclease